MTPEELEERIEEIAEDADKRLDKLEKFMGVSFLEGPQLSQMTPEEFAKLTVPANELPNGEYNFALYQALTNRILADQASVIQSQANRIAELEKRPSGSVSIPTDYEAYPLPAPSGETHDAGDVEGFGNGLHLKSGNFEALLFISDYDNALRILTNHKANADGGHTYAIETEGQQRIDVETFGVGVSYWPPRKNPDGSDFPLTELDKQGGKSIIFKSHAPDNHRARYAQIYTGLPGQGLQIGVSAGKHPDGSGMANVMVNPTIQIEPDGTKSIG